MLRLFFIYLYIMERGWEVIKDDEQKEINIVPINDEYDHDHDRDWETN